MRMKWILSAVAVVILAWAGMAIAQSQNESLGDYARSAKKAKPDTRTQATKVYDNDNLPTDSTLSVVGNPTPEDSADKKDQDSGSATPDSKTAEAAKGDAKSADKTDKKDQPQLKPGQPMQERDKALDALKTRLDEQKKNVDMLAHDLDLTQREYNLKVASFYSDPNRLSNPNSYYDEESKYKEQVAEKQKALDDAKAKLSSMQDEARKQGAPGSMLE